MNKNRPRQFKIFQFINDVIAPAVAARGPIAQPPLLGCDEGLSDELYVGTMCRRLVRSGVVSRSEPLWYRLRQDESGSLISVLGGSYTPELHPDLGYYGKEVRGYSWPDEGVVAAAACNFLHIDRICLLTNNKKRDVDGLYHIIMNEVRPALENIHPKRLGFLVLLRNSAVDLKTYCEAVESRLVYGEIKPGVAWEETP
jgi:hypothetical protein